MIVFLDKQSLQHHIFNNNTGYSSIFQLILYSILSSFDHHILLTNVVIAAILDLKQGPMIIVASLKKKQIAIAPVYFSVSLFIIVVGQHHLNFINHLHQEKLYKMSSYISFINVPNDICKLAGVNNNTLEIQTFKIRPQITKHIQ